MRASRDLSFLSLFVFCAFFGVYFATPVHAQLVMPNIESSLFIRMVPEHPRPGDTVKLYAQSVYYDLARGNNVWSVNGDILAQGIGVIEASFVIGPLGSKNDIVFETTTDTATNSTRIKIVPVELDLLYESDSYTPPFYRGRSLPSEGTYVRLTAIPRFKRTDGSFVAPESLIYTWKENGSTVETLSGKGRNSAVLPSPVLYGADSVSVDVSVVDGSMSGTASIKIPSRKPLLLLYENHPLFGITFNKALGAESFFPETEVTFAAIPYFASAARPDDSSLNYTWTVNDRAVAADSVKKSMLTINSSGQRVGYAQVQLDISQDRNPFFDAHGEWRISFSDTRENNDQKGVVKNPFLAQ